VSDNTLTKDAVHKRLDIMSPSTGCEDPGNGIATPPENNGTFHQTSTALKKTLRTCAASTIPALLPK